MRGALVGDKEATASARSTCWLGSLKWQDDCPMRARALPPHGERALALLDEVRSQPPRVNLARQSGKVCFPLATMFGGRLSN